MRVYVPATMGLLGRWHSTGVVEVDRAFAVTPFLREIHASNDIEELEYVALTHASQSSLMMLGADPAAPRRRVVVALDVTDAEPDRRSGVSIVRLEGAPRFDAVAAVHVDGAEAEKAVVAAVSAYLAHEEAKRAGARTDAGDEVLGALDDRELLWYAPQEIPDLLLGTS